MTDIIKIAGIGMTSVFLISMVKTGKPEFAIQISVITGIIISAYIIAGMKPLLDVFGRLSEKAGLGNDEYAALLKIIGIAFAADFGASLCRDAGESSIAGKIDIAGKVCIVLSSLPILLSVLEVIDGLGKWG